MIKGETVILMEKTSSGYDDFGVETFTETETSVDNVLVGTPTFDQSISELNLSGKRLAYVLGIPKGDTHNWKDTTLKIRGEVFKSYGYPLTQNAANVPGPWNTQVKVERYE